MKEGEGGGEERMEKGGSPPAGGEFIELSVSTKYRDTVGRPHSPSPRQKAGGEVSPPGVNRYTILHPHSLPAHTSTPVHVRTVGRCEDEREQRTSRTLVMEFLS